MNSKKPLFLVKDGGSLKFSGVLGGRVSSSLGKKGFFLFFEGSNPVVTLSVQVHEQARNEQARRKQVRVIRQDLTRKRSAKVRALLV